MKLSKLKNFKWICLLSFIMQVLLVKFVVGPSILSNTVEVLIMLTLSIIQIVSFEASMHSFLRSYEDKVNKLSEREIGSVFKSSLVLVSVLMCGVYIFFMPISLGLQMIILYLIVFSMSLIYYISSILNMAHNHVHDNDYE